MTQDGESYHGYWAQNIYEINTNFGSAADLVALSEALHARGMVFNSRSLSTTFKMLIVAVSNG